MEVNKTQESVTNYVTGNRFYVEMENTLSASFSECSGLAVRIKREAIQEGGVNDQRRVLLGQPEFTDVVLKRGLTDSLVFWEWLEETLKPGEKHRRNINIVIFNQAGETMQCWTLSGAIPVGWKAPAMQAKGNSLAIEELTLSYEGLSITSRSEGGRASMLKPGRNKAGSFSSY